MPWKSAGLVLTYSCDSRCAICHLRCSPAQQGSFMSPDAALEYWHDLKDLAGANLKVHLTGGEPFGDWPALLAVLPFSRITLRLGTRYGCNCARRIVRTYSDNIDPAGSEFFTYLFF